MKKIVLLAIALVAFPAMSFAKITTGSFSVNATVAEGPGGDVHREPPAG